MKTYSISYKINMFPNCCKTWQSCKMDDLTLNGVCIYLHNLQRDALLGCEVKDVTITNN